MGIRTFLITALCLIGSLASAQNTDAGWRSYPAFDGTISTLEVTQNHCYFTSAAHLYSYSQSSGELRHLDHINSLSDSDIKGIYAHPGGKYLLVAYANGNIDILHDDGHVTNLPEIRDANIDGPKGINNVAFGGGRIIVCTQFGIVEYNDDNFEFIDAGRYGENVLSAAATSEHLVLCMRSGESGYYLYFAPLKSKHSKIDNYIKSTSSVYASHLAPLDSSHILEIDKNTEKINILNIDYSSGSLGRTPIAEAAPNSRFHVCKKGLYVFANDQLIDFFTGESNSTQLPSSLNNRTIAYDYDGKNIWGADESGMGLYALADGRIETIIASMLPVDAISCVNAGYMKWNSKGDRLYISNLCISHYRSSAPGEGTDIQTTDIIENGKVQDASLKTASASHTRDIDNQQRNGSTRMYGDSNWIIEDPDNSDIYYCANNHEGLYVISYDNDAGEYVEIGKFNHENSPIADNWGARVNDVNIDPQGNLWVGFRGGCGYAVLPSEKRKMKPENIKKSDWITIDYLSEVKFEYTDMMSLLCKKSNAALLIQGKYDFGIVCADTRGTWSDPTDDAWQHAQSFTDQDGNTVRFHYATFLLEDSNGSVWVGTSEGVFVIDDPEKFAHNPSQPVRRLKVARNDGTNFADYLLGSDQVNWISMDENGRKWIATEQSGLYLVSATGDEILANFTTENSPLPSNTVNCVEYSQNEQLVYAGTPQGVYTLMTSMASAQDDYDNVRVFPNPASPNRHSHVTISGLRSNSTVKIADVAGNVVYGTLAEDGMAVWPLTTGLKSGVFYIYANSEDDGIKYNIVTKVAVVK